MRSGVARQNANVHANTLIGQPHEPFHFRALKMSSAGRGIDVQADTRSNDSAETINEIAIQRGMMVRILFQNFHAATW